MENPNIHHYRKFSLSLSSLPLDVIYCLFEPASSLSSQFSSYLLWGVFLIIWSNVYCLFWLGFALFYFVFRLAHASPRLASHPLWSREGPWTPDLTSAEIAPVPTTSSSGPFNWVLYKFHEYLHINICVFAPITCLLSFMLENLQKIEGTIFDS